MPPEPPPLLTIAIPTFNRSGYLDQMLSMLAPQVAEFPQVEVIICDNASPDGTPRVCAEMEQRFTRDGVNLRVVRHETNIGSDANFVACFHLAHGQFFWMCGDDDVIMPGALRQIVPLLENTPDLDMIFVLPFGFRDGQDPEAQHKKDPWGRTLHTYKNALQFARVVNVMFTFISAMIVNRDRALALMTEPPDAFLSTNLVQLSWSLPLLKQHRRSLVLWTRPVAGREGNANGYSLGRVFGEQLKETLERLLPGRKDLQGAVLGTALRRWFPVMLIELRSARNTTMNLEEAHQVLAKTFAWNPRYWLFTYPVIKLPLPLANAYEKALRVVNKTIAFLHLPGIWRKRT